MCMPRRHPLHRSGFTIAETLVTLGIFSILLLGVGAAVGIAVRAVDDSATAPARTARTATGISQLAADLAAATSFIDRSPHAVEFAVPDRTGDAAPETLRYEWTTKPDGPITRSVNGGPAVVVAPAVSGFDLTYQTRTTSSRVTSSNTSSTGVTLASFSSWSGIVPIPTDYRLSATAWICEYVQIPAGNLPSNGARVLVNRATLQLRSAGSGGTVTVSIHRPATAGSPQPATTPIGTPVTVATSLMTSSYASVNFDFTDVELTSSDTELVIVAKGSGTGSADAQYLYSTLAVADSGTMLYTSNSGTAWNPTKANLLNQNDLKYTLTASRNTSSSAETLTPHYYLNSVGISVLPPSTGGDTIRTTVLVHNTPEVSGP